MALAANALVDNDVLIKVAAYCLLGDLMAALGGPKAVGVLGAARYVVRDRLARDGRIRDRERASAAWQAFLVEAEEVEPSTAEVDLATTIEEAASYLTRMHRSG